MEWVQAPTDEQNHQMSPLMKPFRRIRWQFLIEIALMIVLGWHASYQYADFDPSLHLGGLEVENLTTSAHFLDYSFDKLGYIPYWQPFSNEGQPLFDEPIGMVTNPVNFLSVALLGADNGIKFSVILHFMIAGVGGWFLAQSLGMGVIGRVLLGALLVVKGNMPAAFGAGSFQLGVPQAYFPWILAGALAVFRRSDQRWPPVLLATSYALMFFTTELYYSLPLLIIILFCFFFYTVRFEFEPFRIRVDTATTRRFVFACLLTTGLIAVIALPIGLTYGLRSGHASMLDLPEYDVGKVLYQFIYPDMLFKGLFSEDAYSYVIPLWFIALIFLFIPPLPWFHRSADPEKDKPLWLIGGVGFLFFLAWGLALRPFVPWIYQNVPLVGQWRFPDRMLAVASFLFVFLIAFRADGLHRALVTNIRYDGKKTGRVTKFLVTTSVFLAASTALIDVYQNYLRWGYLQLKDPYIQACVVWLRQNYPDQFLMVQRRDFLTMVPFIREGVRMSDIGADYYTNGVPPTLYPYDLSKLPAPFYMPAWDQSTVGLREQGLIPIRESPPLSPQFSQVSCVWRNPNAPSYAFSVPLGDLQEAQAPLSLDKLTPVRYLWRTPEHIWLEADPNPTRVTVVVAQDVAYPGWTVLVDGEPAKLESVGRMIGVELLPGTTPKRVEFIFTAPLLKLGGAITLIAAVGAVLYLLKAERVREWWRRSRRAGHPLVLPAAIPALKPVSQPVMVAAPIPLEVSANGKVSVEPEKEVQFVRVQGQGSVQLILPPSDRPYHVEVVSPSRWNGMVAQVTMAGMVIVLTVLVVSRTRKK